MTDRLLATFRDASRRALDGPRPGAPEPLFEALAWSLALSVAGVLDAAPRATRDRLRTAGRSALDALAGRAGPAARDDDLRLALTVARAGLDALAGRTGAAPAATLRLHPAPHELVALLGARLDAYAAGACAYHVARCARCTADLRAARLAGDATPPGRSEPASTPPLLAAAADPVSVRPPGTGRLVGTLRSPAVEAVLFEGTAGEPRTLAVYARESLPVRLVAAGLTTTETLAGYWVGRVDGDPARLDAVLHVGDVVRPWRLALSRRRPR